MSDPIDPAVPETELRFAMPVMSWDKPIEQEILEFVRRMASDMEMQSRRNIWGGTRKGAENYARAYRTVEQHIVKEMMLRHEIAELKATDKEVKDE